MTPLPRDNLPVDGQRIWDDLMALAEVTEPGRPYTRRSFSATFLDGRAWLTERFRTAGLTVRIDAAGNLIGRLEGTEAGAGTIALGSHSDTVPEGGRFDGTAGVIVALEVVRSLQERGVRLRHAVEVVDCLAEEVSEFGLSCIGSRAIAGALPEDFLNRSKADGETLAQAIGRMGGVPDEIGLARRVDLCAWLELHIEQGRALEAAGLDLGVVTSVVGITRVEIVVEGRADHAGTTGIADRRDALVAAASIVLAVRGMAEAGAAAGQGYFVATVGEIEVTPNAANVVPGTARLLVEVRAVTEAAIDRFLADLAGSAERCAQAYDARIASFRVLSRGQPVGFDPALAVLLREVSAAQGLRTQDMASGAGHDAVFFARIAPTAMLFVPSLDGRSHCPEEWTEQRHLVEGAAVLFEAVRQLDVALTGP